MICPTSSEGKVKRTRFLDGRGSWSAVAALWTGFDGWLLGGFIDSKIKKHQEIVTLAIAKRDTVDRLLSKTLADNQITDGEFQLIMTEFSRYNGLKEAVRAKLTRQPSRPDVEKIRKDVRGEVEEEFRKKLNALAAASN